MVRKLSNSRAAREGIAERIKEIMVSIKSSAGTLRADWVLLGEALAQARDTFPDTKTFGKWIKENGLAVIDQATRSAAIWMHENPRKVELVHKDSPTLSSPKRIRDAYNALVKKAIKTAIATAMPAEKVAAALDLTVKEVDDFMDAALQSREETAREAAQEIEASVQDAPQLIAAGLKLLQPVRDADLQIDVLDQIRHELDLPERRRFAIAEAPAEEIADSLLTLPPTLVLQVVALVEAKLDPKKAAKPVALKPVKVRAVRGRRAAVKAMLEKDASV